MKDKICYLTFDDGPNPPYTSLILDILKKERIKATFFVCGQNAKEHPKTIKKIASEGHTIGNHSHYHRFLPTLIGAIYKETIETQKIIEDLVPQKEKLFRSPWLMAPFWLKHRLKKKGFKIIEGIVGGDWKTTITPEEITDKILSQTKNGTIIILHDGHNTNKNAKRPQTVKALEQIIKKLKRNGFSFGEL